MLHPRSDVQITLLTLLRVVLLPSVAIAVLVASTRVLDVPFTEPYLVLAIITALLVLIFGMQSFNDVSVTLPAPEVSAAASAEILKFAAPGITAVAVIFGLMFTPLGRRLRAELT